MFSFMLPTAPGDTCNGHAHFTDEESQLQRGESLVQGHTPGGRWRQRSFGAGRLAPGSTPVPRPLDRPFTQHPWEAWAQRHLQQRLEAQGACRVQGPCCGFALHFGNPGAAFSLCDQLNCLSGSGRRASAGGFRHSRAACGGPQPAGGLQLSGSAVDTVDAQLYSGSVDLNREH